MNARLRPSAIHDPERLSALRATGLLDSPAEEALDHLVRLGAEVLQAPMVAISLIDDGRQLLKCAVGFAEPYGAARELPLSHSFCKHVVGSGRRLFVQDARKHPWLRKSPAIAELNMIAYAGIPLRAHDGHPVGSFCVADSRPRRWPRREQEALADLAAVAQSQLRHLARQAGSPSPPPPAASTGDSVEALVSALPALPALVEQSIVGIGIVQGGRIRYASPRLAEMFGYTGEQLLALASVLDLVAEEDRALVAENLRKRIEGEADHLHYTFRGKRREGSVIEVEVHGRRTDLDGAPAIIGVLLDVTERRQAEAALRRSEEHFRALVEGMWGIIHTLDAQGTIQYISPSVEEVLGYPPDEMVGRKGDEFVHPDDVARVGSAFAEDIRHPGASRTLELRLRHRDGSWRTVEIRGNVTTDASGAPMVIVNTRDVTRRREAEDALRRSEERYRLVARATNDVLWEWEVTTGQIRWSEPTAKILRYAQDELGTTIDWWYERLHPEERERVISDLHTLIGGASEVWSSEYRFLRGDGSYVALLDRGYIVRDERGRALRMVGSMLDVTERRRSEDAQRLLARASGLLETSLDPAFTLAGLAHLIVPALADYCLIDLIEEDALRRAAAAHVSVAKEDLLARPEPLPLKDAADEPTANAIRRREPVLVVDCTDAFLEASARDARERERLRRLRPCSLLAVPLTVHDRVLGVITLAAAESGRRYGPMDLLVLEDLGRRTAMALENARLFRRTQQAVADREHILGVVSHDLRNPLNTIQIAAGLLHEVSEERRSDNLKWLDIIRRSSAQMDRMIADLLDLSVISSGHYEIAAADHDLASVLHEAIEAMEPLARQKRITLRCEQAETLSVVRMDAHRILRVFSNLIGNALKFTPEGGTVTLRVQRDGAEVVFSVSDTGPGIPRELLPHVFDRYWQARRGDRRGAGLGLSIARGIVEAHGGRAWVESREGEGATFSFSIPIESREPASLRPRGG